MNALLLALAVVHSQGQGSIDEGTLLVRQDTVEVAREAFRLTPARAAAGSWTLATTIRYDRTRPVVVLDPILELGPDSVATTLEYTVADPRDPMRIVGQFTRGRFVVRMLGRRTERAREYPTPPPAAVLDDSVFALYLPVAWLGRAQPVQVTAVFARAGRRELLAVRDLGIETTTLNRDPAELRHITVTGGENRLVHVWPGLAVCQRPVPATLSLADAIALARANSPVYRQAINDRAPAAWAVRSAWSTMLVPSVSASGGIGYAGPGQQTFLTSNFSQSVSTLSSSYSVGLDWSLSGQTLTQPGLRKAQLSAADADVAGAETNL